MAGFAAKYGSMVGRAPAQPRVGFAAKYGNLISKAPEAARPTLIYSSGEGSAPPEMSPAAKPLQEARDQGFDTSTASNRVAEAPPPPQRQPPSAPPGALERINPFSELFDALSVGAPPRPLSQSAPPAARLADAYGGALTGEVGNLVGLPGRLAGNLSAAVSPPAGQAELGPRSLEMFRASSPLATGGFGMAPVGAPPARTRDTDSPRAAALGEVGADVGMLAAASNPVGALGMGLSMGVPALGDLAGAGTMEEAGHALSSLTMAAPMVAHGARGLPSVQQMVGAVPRAAPPLQIPGGGIDQGSVTDPLHMYPQPPQPPPQLPPAPVRAQITGPGIITDPSHLLPPSLDTAPRPTGAGLLPDPRTGELVAEGAWPASGETMRVPPGGFSQEFASGQTLPPAPPPTGPARFGMNEVPETNPARLLPRGTGDIVQVPPGGFALPTPEMPAARPMAPELAGLRGVLDALAARPEGVADRRALAQPDAVPEPPVPAYPPLSGAPASSVRQAIARPAAPEQPAPTGGASMPKPPPYPGLPGEASLGQSATRLVDRRVTGDPSSIADILPPPEPPPPAVIDGEFERLPHPTAQWPADVPPEVRAAREAATPPIQARPIEEPVRGAQNFPRQRAKVVRYADDPAAYEAALNQARGGELTPDAPAPLPPTPAAKRDDGQPPIWPDLPPMSLADRELVPPTRHTNVRDSMVTRSTAVGSILGPTEKRMAGAGRPIREGTGGTGLADIAAESTARAAQRAEGFTTNVLQGIETKFPEGSPGDLAAARWVEGKATPEDVAFLRQNPDLQAAAERWQRGAQEAMSDPAFEIKGTLENYLTHARSRGQSPSVMDFFNELERGSSNPALQDNPLTSYMQRSRTGEGPVPPSLVRAARAYGKAGGFQLDLKPLLKQAKEFLDTKAPDGSHVFDAADKTFVTNWLNDSVMGREQLADALVRRTPGISHGTALLNKALSTVGLPTVQSPLKTAINLGKGLANITLVRPAAAAVSHFLGDLWPKIAEKGVAGVGEYASGADHALRQMSDAEWSRIERLGVAQRLPTSELSNPALRGLSTAAQRIMGTVNTVDTISKIGTFYAELQRLVKTGMDVAEAESKAATITRARNYYSNAVNSIPLSGGRVAGPFYQFLRPSINAVDNLRNWAVQRNGAAYIRTGLGAAGLWALGQATGTDILHRVHLSPHGIGPAMMTPGSGPAILNVTDPFGIATGETRATNRKEKMRDPDMKAQRRQAYLDRKRRQRE